MAVAQESHPRRAHRGAGAVQDRRVRQQLPTEIASTREIRPLEALIALRLVVTAITRNEGAKNLLPRARIERGDHGATVCRAYCAPDD